MLLATHAFDGAARPLLTAVEPAPGVSSGARRPGTGGRGHPGARGVPPPPRECSPPRRRHRGHRASANHHRRQPRPDALGSSSRQAAQQPADHASPSTPVPRLVILRHESATRAGTAHKGGNRGGPIEASDRGAPPDRPARPLAGCQTRMNTSRGRWNRSGPRTVHSGVTDLPPLSVLTALLRITLDDPHDADGNPGRPAQRWDRPGSPGASFRQVPCSGSYSSRSKRYMSSPRRMSEYGLGPEPRTWP